jgi:hypothetical protein
MMNKRPSFFIIGAPKCGTTSLNEYLAQHPQIGMAEKEIHFFGKDLGIGREAETEEEYLSFFSGLKGEIFGEASVWTFYSKMASAELKAFNPQAKLILLLRNPWDLLQSLHAQHLMDADENLKDLNEALERDLLREPDNPTSWSKNFKSRPLLWKSLLFSECLKQWKSDWGDQLKVVLFQDLAENPLQTFKSVCAHIGVSSSFEPSFEVHNKRQSIRSAGMQALIDRPNSNLQKLARSIVPNKTVRHRIMSAAKSFNTTKANQASSLSLENQIALSDLLSEDIERTRILLGRELNHWL